MTYLYRCCAAIRARSSRERKSGHAKKRKRQSDLFDHSQRVAHTFLHSLGCNTKKKVRSRSLVARGAVSCGVRERASKGELVWRSSVSRALVCDAARRRSKGATLAAAAVAAAVRSSTPVGRRCASFFCRRRNRKQASVRERAACATLAILKILRARQVASYRALVSHVAAFVAVDRL